jgi:uncharacterized membrane protein
VPEPSLLSYTHVIYGLHTLSVVWGLLGSGSVVGRFVFGLPSIVAVIMNYVRRNDAASTFLESHFRWQIRTFWFALLWLVVTAILSWPLVLVGIGIPLWWIGRGATGIWVIYRVARGWLSLRDAKPLLMATPPASGGAA